MTGDVAKGEKGQGITGGELFERRRQGALRLYRAIVRAVERGGGHREGKMSRVVRLAGFTEAMREHVPVLVAKLRERFPGLKVTLQEIDQRGAEQIAQATIRPFKT